MQHSAEFVALKKEYHDLMDAVQTFQAHLLVATHYPAKDAVDKIDLVEVRYCDILQFLWCGAVKRVTKVEDAAP